MKQSIYFDRVEEGLQTQNFTKKQIDALMFFLKNYVGSKFYYAMSCVSCYVGNRDPFFINRESEAFKSRNVSRRQVDRCINWLLDNEFIFKISEAKKPHELEDGEKTKCALYMPMNVGFFKFFRHALNTRQIFRYNTTDDWEPDLMTAWGSIDMNFIQSLQQQLNTKLLKDSRDLYPLINFTIRQKDLDFMLLYGGSGRACSDYANELSIEHISENYKKITRQDILAKKWGTTSDKINEFDVKSSIPHIARLMNYHVWSQEDAYEIMFKDYFKMYFNLKWTKELRNDCKHLFMLLAFNSDESTPKKTSNINYYIKFDNKNFLPFFTKNKIEFNKNQVEELRNNVKEYCGYVPNNIFVVESSLYICFIWKLIEKGYFPKGHIEFVFDAIESDEAMDKEVFLDILDKTAYAFVKKFMNNNFEPVFTFKQIIEEKDYDRYSMCWNTTENHYKAVFLDPKPINDESIEILDRTYGCNGELCRLYFRKGPEAAEKKLANIRADTKTLYQMHLDLRTLGKDKQSMGLDKQSLKQDKQSLGLDKQSLERKARNKKVKKQIKQLINKNPNIKMKEIEKKLNISPKYRRRLMKEMNLI